MMPYHENRLKIPKESEQRQQQTNKLEEKSFVRAFAYCIYHL